MDDTIDDTDLDTAPATPSTPLIRSLDSGRSAPTDATTPPTDTAPADPWAALPKKFEVRAADGTLDRDASFAKMAEAHHHLERRLSTGSGRPPTPEEYVIATPQGFEEAFDPASPEFKAIAAEAHEQGLSPAQLQWAVEKHLESASRLVAGASELDKKTAEAELAKVWPDDASYSNNIAAADLAVTQLGADLGEPFLRSVRNNPAAIQFLARVGAQLREDTPPSGVQTQAGAGIEALIASPAYSDSKHADHATVTARVNAHFARQPGARNPI